MSKNTKHKDYKRYLALNRRSSEIYAAQKALGYVELEKPIHRGYEAYLVLREDIARRDDAWVFQYIIDNFATQPWSIDGVFYRKHRRWYNDNRPKIRSISESGYLQLPPQVAKYFYHDYKEDKASWNGVVYKYYSCTTVPEHFFVMKVVKSYITHKKIIDGDLVSEEKFVDDQISALMTKMNPFNERGYSSFKKDINKRNRRKDKMALRTNLNTIFINDSHQWHKYNGSDITEKEFVLDSDWTDWVSSSAWSQDFVEFKYRPRNEAAWWYW